MKEEAPRLPDLEVDLPVFDLAGVLDRMMGDTDLAWALVDAFLMDGPIQIRELESFLRNGNIDGSKRRTHSIKGAAATVGGERLKTTALAMEEAAHAGNLRSVEDAMAKLQINFLEFAAEAKALRAQGPLARGK